jgi:hypothetical protein
MALYVIDINEKDQRGKAMKKMLQSDDAARLIPMDEYEALEDKIIAEAIAKSRSSRVLTDEETDALFIRLRKSKQ